MKRTQFLSKPKPPSATQAPTPQTATPSSAALIQRDPKTLSPAEILQLQRTHGNQFVQRLLGQEKPTPAESFADFQQRLGVPVQAKLTVTPAGDQYEAEADAMSQQMMQTMRVQRQTDDDDMQFQRQEDDEMQLQRASDFTQGGTVNSGVETQIRNAQGGGQPIPDNVRSPMENAFGADFSGVRVHIDNNADTLNRSVQAKAFTTGSDIFFSGGTYQPHSQSGQELLAHELTHVVQQQEIPPQNTVQRALTTTEDVKSSMTGKKVKWEPFKTTIGNAPTKTGQTIGLGVDVKDSQPSTPLSTQIEWKEVESIAKEGQEVTAEVLGPDHKLGSEPDNSADTEPWVRRRKLLTKETGITYIAGHLLNNNLGGPGNDARNLTAIPGFINSKQSAQIEEEVKDIVNKQHLFVYYQVKVSYGDDPQIVDPQTKKNVRYAKTITSTWQGLEFDTQSKKTKPSGSKKAVVITIPSPTDIAGAKQSFAKQKPKLKKTLEQASPFSYTVDLSTSTDSNLLKSKTVTGHKANISHSDIVLTDAGYVKIATDIKDELGKIINTQAEQLRKLQQDLKKSSSQQTVDQQEIKILSQSLQELKKDLAHTESLLENTQKKLDEKLDAILELQKENKKIKDELEEANEEIQQKEIELQITKQDLEKTQLALQKAHNEIDRLQQELENTKKQLESEKHNRRLSHDRHEIVEQELTERLAQSNLDLEFYKKLSVEREQQLKEMQQKMEELQKQQMEIIKKQELVKQSSPQKPIQNKDVVVQSPSTDQEAKSYDADQLLKRIKLKEEYQKLDNAFYAEAFRDAWKKVHNLKSGYPSRKEKIYADLVLNIEKIKL